MAKTVRKWKYYISKRLSFILRFALEIYFVKSDYFE